MLHIVTHHQFVVQFERITKGDAILFLADSILSLHKKGQFKDYFSVWTTDFACYVLQADMLARGLRENELIAGLQIIDYSGFVDLTVAHKVIKTWN